MLVRRKHIWWSGSADRLAWGQDRRDYASGAVELSA